VRIALVTHNFPRSTGDVAGSFLLPLVHGLMARGHVVRVLAPSDEGRGGEDDVAGIPVRRIRYAPRALETIAYRGAMQAAARSPAGLVALAGLLVAFRRAVKDEMRDGADVVHAHWWFPAGLAVPPKVPMVLTMHGTDVSLLGKSRLVRMLGRRVLERAQVVTAVSRELANRAQAQVPLYLPDACVQAMPVQPYSLDWSTGGGGLVMVARLVPQKRVHLAIETLACLRDLGCDMPLTIVGDGPERSRLEALAAQHGIADRVVFVGAVAPAEVSRYLAAADLMLFPAHAEGFGLAVAEALMAGVPVVACWDGGGVLDMVPETGAGRRVLPRADALADAALDVLQDPERFAQARVEGERWRMRLSPDVVAARCEAWYREAIGA
jgi:glycosyltransferase involved in cell wall biosynthesis